MSDKYYPRLSSIVKIEQLPEQLNFVQGGLNTIFDNLGFRNLRVNRSLSGDSVSFELDIISYKELKLDIPGTGMALSLNPGGATGVTAIPISLTTQLGIKRYLKNFNLTTFSFTPNAFLDLAFQIFSLTDGNLITLTAANFISSSTPLNDLATTLHDNYGLTITLPVSSDPETAISDILTAANATSGFNLKVSIIAEYIIDSGSVENSFNNVEKLFFLSTGGNTIDKIKDLFIPKISARLLLDAGIVFSRDILIPVDNTTLEPIDGNTTLLFAQSEFTFSTQGGIGFDENLSLTLTPTLSQIGNTGLLIGFTGAKLDLSRTKNIPEATVDGRPDDFIGAYVQNAEIVLPKKWFKNQSGATAEIFGHNLLIGTGGISGTLGLRAIGGSTDPVLPLIGDPTGTAFYLGLKLFDIELHQNSFVKTDIAGELRIPGFKDSTGAPAMINIIATFDNNGDFKVTASEADGFKKIRIPDVLEFTLRSISVGNQDDHYFIEVSGNLDFIATGVAALPKDIEIKKLVIWDDGKIELQGGTITLAKPLSLKIGPAKLSVTAIGFGSDERQHGIYLRKYNYFEFAAGLSVNPGGVDARGDGIKFYFTVDNNGTTKLLHCFIRIESINIDLIIPSSATEASATLLLKGYLSMKPAAPPDVGDEYIGGVAFSMPKSGLGGSVAMRMNPDVPAFLIDVEVDLPSPIIIFSGVGIYGFRGLFGQRYLASREAPALAAAGLQPDGEWYQYYKLKVSPDYKEGIQVSKFARKQGFSIGLGASIATAGDGGKLFSSKVFFMVSLPGVFLLQGQAGILRERIKITDTTDPPFSLLLVITKESFTADFGVDYKLPEESGKILRLSALMEMAFFFKTPNAWYLNVGRDLPETKRVTGRIFDLFDVYSYLMFSGTGIKAGAGASFIIENENYHIAA